MRDATPEAGTPPSLSPAAFFRLTNVSRETQDRLEAYADLLLRWQPRINLVGRETLADLWRRHMADSAQLAPLIGDRAARIADIGSGAGFPGLLLAVLGFADVHLIESDVRKCAFLREAARVCAVAPTIHNARAETLTNLAADVVVARAVAPLPRLLDLAFPLLRPNSVCLFQKGRRYATELTESRKVWDIDCDIIPSATDSEGVILRLKAISRGARHDGSGNGNP